MNMSPKVNSCRLVFLRGSNFKMLQIRPIQMKQEIQLEWEFLLARSTAKGERVKRFEIVLVAKRNPKFNGANGDGSNGADVLWCNQSSLHMGIYEYGDRHMSPLALYYK